MDPGKSDETHRDNSYCFKGTRSRGYKVSKVSAYSFTSEQIKVKSLVGVNKTLLDKFRLRLMLYRENYLPNIYLHLP